MDLYEVLPAFVWLTSLQILDARYCLTPRWCFATQQMFRQRSDWISTEEWAEMRDAMLSLLYGGIAFFSVDGNKHPWRGAAVGIPVFLVALYLGRKLTQLASESTKTPSEIGSEVSSDREPH